MENKKYTWSNVGEFVEKYCLNREGQFVWALYNAIHNNEKPRPSEIQAYLLSRPLRK